MLHSIVGLGGPGLDIGITDGSLSALHIKHLFHTNQNIMITMSVEQSLRSIITPGISKRSDFPLRPTSMALLLVIDIQHGLTDLDAFSTEYKFAVSFPRMITNTKRLIETVRSNRDMKMHNKGGGSEIIFTYLQALTDNSRDVSLDYKLSGGVLSNLPNPSNPAHSYME